MRAAGRDRGSLDDIVHHILDTKPSVTQEEEVTPLTHSPPSHTHTQSTVASSICSLTPFKKQEKQKSHT